MVSQDHVTCTQGSMHKVVAMEIEECVSHSCKNNEIRPPRAEPREWRKIVKFFVSPRCNVKPPTHWSYEETAEFKAVERNSGSGNKTKMKIISLQSNSYFLSGNAMKTKKSFNRGCDRLPFLVLA